MRIFNLRHSSSRRPYARRCITRILVLSPSTKPRGGFSSWRQYSARPSQLRSTMAANFTKGSSRCHLRDSVQFSKKDAMLTPIVRDDNGGVAVPLARRPRQDSGPLFAGQTAPRSRSRKCVHKHKTGAWLAFFPRVFPRASGKNLSAGFSVVVIPYLVKPRPGVEHGNCALREAINHYQMITYDIS